MSLQVLHAVELSVALGTTKRAAAWREQLQFGPLGSWDRRLKTLLELLLALAIVSPQQAGHMECLTTEFTGMEVGEGVAEAAVGSDVDSISLWRGFLDGSGLLQLEDAWKVRGKRWWIYGWKDAHGHVWSMPVSQTGAGSWNVLVLALKI